MIAYNVTQRSVESIVNRISRDKYDGNIYAACTEIRHRDRTDVSFTLQARNSKGRGTRTSYRGRAIPKASWEVHYDVIEALFQIGATRVKSALADYKSLDDFYRTAESVADKNVGPMISPVSFGDTTRRVFSE